MKKVVAVKGKQKRPSAEKRVITSAKKRLINQSFKSKVKTVIKKFETSLSSGDSVLVNSGLNDVYSVLDKCVKRGVFKLNKSSRLKSRLSSKI
ncbi:MAG: 30S ribosomal protein S20 [Victivallaceae bacterium]